MNLHDLYARVTAKRPELAVEADDGPWTLAHDGTEWDWLCHSIDDVLWRCEDVSDSTAAALILARWVEALPDGSHLMVRGRVPSNRGWTIYPSSQELDYYTTPIEALAAFYLGDAQ